MSIFRSNDFNNINWLQPVHGDHSDDDQQNQKKKKKVQYQGRSWAEQEDTLPIDSRAFDKASPQEKTESSPLYADKLILEQAKYHLSQFTTLEEKIGSLCFILAVASYDSFLQEELELAVQQHQIGGILFEEGDFSRQVYLIEHLQELSKISLLFGNGFLHGLSFYFEESIPFETLKDQTDVQYFVDLGKKIALHNRKLGVHFQFDSPLLSLQTKDLFSEEKIQAFRKGIREAKGIVAKQKRGVFKPFYSQPSKQVASFAPAFSSLVNEQIISETIGLRKLEFIEIKSLKEDVIVNSFNQSFDGILLSTNLLSEVITRICDLIRQEKISIEEIDKRVLRLLLIKMLLVA